MRCTICYNFVCEYFKIKIMATVKLLLNKYRARRDGTYPLVFQLIHDRQKKLLYTPYKLFPEEFDEPKGKVLHISDDRRNRREVRRINRDIVKQRKSLDRHIETLEMRREKYSVADVVFRYRIEHDNLSLLRYLDIQIERKQNLGKHGMAAALRSTRSSLAAFVGMKIVHLNDLNGPLVRDYEEFLMGRGVCPNTICYYMRNLKSIFNQAVQDGYTMTTADPFRFIRTKQAKTVKRALERDTLRRLSEADFSQYPHLEVARDIFLFGFYCRGMSFVDILHLKKSDINNGVIGYRRHKTNQWLQIAVTPQLEQLMHKYDNPSQYVFPILADAPVQEQYRLYRLALERVNRNLKRVAKICNVDIALTTHMSRHSWATQAKEAGAPVAVISEGLGHTSEKTTRIYLKEFDHSVVDAVNAKVTAL